jgi:cellulose synthase/poly-beta-1,6-N-acetylglucosamine synthase-like glycosyltransferase
MPEPLTVVVPTRDRPQLLERCLAALQAELLPGDQLVVVDSAPQVHPARPGARVEIVRVAERGASRARNAGWRAASHDLVAFVDDDVVVAPGWRQALTARTADFVLGKVEEHPDDAAVEHPLALTSSTTGTVVDRSGPLVPGGSGNLLVRRTALEGVRGFDEQLGPGTWFGSAEDLDLVDRLVAAGCTGWFEPTAVGWHVQWRSGAEALRVHWAYGKGMGARLSRLARVDRQRARLLLPGVTRLGGLRTVVTEGRRRTWGPPIAWRAGALVGLVAGFARLPRRPR